MVKKYNVKENNKIEDGKKRLVPEPSSCTDEEIDVELGLTSEDVTEWLNEDNTVSVEEILDGLPGLDSPIEVTSEEYDHDVQEVPKDEYRPAIPKDMVFDKEVQVRSPEGDCSHDLRVTKVLNPNDSLKAFIANDGHTYGLELTFVKVSK